MPRFNRSQQGPDPPLPFPSSPPALSARECPFCGWTSARCSGVRPAGFPNLTRIMARRREPSRADPLRPPVWPSHRPSGDGFLPSIAPFHDRVTGNAERTRQCRTL